jgi:hypothetical protein
MVATTIRSPPRTRAGASPIPWARRLGLVSGPLSLAALLLVALPRPARAFGDAGAFDPRVLLTGSQTNAAHASAPSRWSCVVHADDAAIVTAPFLYWSGDAGLAPLTGAELAGLRRFFALGGVLFVDDAGVDEHGDPGPFGRDARREIARALPDAAPVVLGIDHVVFRTFYYLRRAVGRVEGPASLEAIVRGGQAQVLFSEHDLGGALARGPTGGWERPVVPGGEAQRERAIRLAVNIAMYALCSNYKDDQVHAPFLMRHRALSTP